MSEELTPRQQILLWDLVARGGDALQKELKPAVKPAERDPLKTARLISVSKDGRATRLTLEEAGWDYVASRRPDFAKSIGSKYDRPILQFVLERIQAYARREGVALATILAEGAAAPTAEGDRETASPPRETVAQEIRRAFFEIAGRPPMNQVRLRALRGRLSHIARDMLDEALIAMRETGRARFSKLSNPSDIAAEGDALLTIGDQQFHTIWVES
jgi:hypothetical protein